MRYYRGIAAAWRPPGIEIPAIVSYSLPPSELEGMTWSAGKPSPPTFLQDGIIISLFTRRGKKVARVSAITASEGRGAGTFVQSNSIEKIV